MKIRTAKYHIRQALTGIFKNRLMSVASMAAVAACSFILIISLCIVMNLGNILKSIETNVGISVFLNDSVSDEQAADLKSRIEAIPYIKTVEYKSKEDAFAWAEEEWKDRKDILSGFENDNPFPRSFDITIENIKYQSQVVKNLENLQQSFENEIIAQENGYDQNKIVIYDDGTSQASEVQPEETSVSSQTFSDDYEFKGIRKIRHAQREAEALMAVNTVMRVVSVILIFILSAVSIAIIMNTIKLTVFIRRNEINIMKYVGATDWFIRWPFVIEGAVIGFAGALIPSVICFFCYIRGYKGINEKLSMLKSIIQLIEPSRMFSVLIPVTAALGIFLGVFASVTSIRKHLDV